MINRKFYKTRLLAIVPLGLGLMATHGANAGFVMMLDDLGDANPAIIVYDGTGSDLNGVGGVISYIGAVGAFTVNVTTGVSKPVIGPGALDLNSINVSGAAGTLQVSIADTDFFAGQPSYTASWGGTSDGAVDLSFLYGASNQEFVGTEFANGNFVTSSGNTAFSGAVTNAISPASPYSLTISTSITHTGASQATSFNATIAPVPVPGAFLLFGSALAGLGLSHRFKPS